MEHSEGSCPCCKRPYKEKAKPGTFGYQLRKQLEEQGMSKRELSRRLAVATERSPETWMTKLYNYEHRTSPTLKVVYLIAEALGCEPRSLLPERNPTPTE